MTISGLPFDDFRDLLGRLPVLADPAPQRFARMHEAARGGSATLGRIEDIAAWLARSSGRPVPRVLRPQLALFVGTHATPDADPADAARERIEELAAGGDPLSRLCLAADLGLQVYDLALDLPVADIRVEAALDERACAATMAFGMEAVAGGTDLLCVSALQTDGGVSAEAVFGVVFDEETAGPALSAGAVAALQCHRGHLADPLEALRRLGGREMAAIAGAIIAARTEKVPVILDGAVALAAAGLLHAISPAVLDHCLLADADGREAAIGRRLGLAPLLDLKIRPGEGRSAALAAGLVKAAAQVAA